MDFKQLRYFIAIAEERNITAAASRLHMSQPPLSMQLKQLEEELGVKLVERNGKSLSLTDKGNVLYKHALHLVNSLEEVKNEITETAEGRRGKLSIGVNTLSVPGFSEWIKAFNTQYPLVMIKIVQNDSVHLSELVKNREIELAFVRLPLEHQGLVYQNLFNERFVFVSKTAADGMTMEEMSSVPLILPSTEGLGSYNIIVDAFSKQGYQPSVIGECSDMKVLLDMVSAGIGATIVPQSVLELHSQLGLHVSQIPDASMTSSLGVIWLEQHFISAPGKHFLSLVEIFLKEGLS
ncbi:LysR family transcriptional regulator [Bacillus sp. FJAT-27251]|uniref:LysR family transcriptional regulator n=1 Tax=Bacillus sp. FJAT-27251 TaxID=1684142 RepID=UPI0006A77452|nr:LysR family transcriptional regulator [Bacillus sp. FJAT-27251]